MELQWRHETGCEPDQWYRRLLAVSRTSAHAMRQRQFLTDLAPQPEEPPVEANSLESGRGFIDKRPATAMERLHEYDLAGCTFIRPTLENSPIDANDVSCQLRSSELRPRRDGKPPVLFVGRSPLSECSSPPAETR